VAEKAAIEAEGYFRSGRMHCAEAVLYTIRNHFAPDTPEELLRMAGGFGGGSGSGCICGAVSGGTMAIGLVVKDDKKRVNRLTKELHKWFKEQYGATCCKIITTGGKKECPLITGSVAGKVAELLVL
jgi:C_GCAxxG_C_C family probable redox protein